MTTFTLNVDLEQDPESGWWTSSVRELPGCVSQGETQRAARLNALSAAVAYLEVAE